MRVDRRTFLKIAGVAALGVGIEQALSVLAGEVAPHAPSLPLRGALPTAQTLTAKRWAMVIDLPKCLAAGDCTDCISACHQAHNVPHFDNPKEEVKWVWKEAYENAFVETTHEFNPTALAGRLLPVLCNHCDNPACVRVCPTQATWKRYDGIVMMDFHRCIGCRFCVAACPYGSRSFNWKDPRLGLDTKNLSSDFPTRTKGVVEKCNFCEERLAKGQVPACVDACKAKALVFGDLQDPNSAVRGILQSRYSIVRKPNLGTRPQVYYVPV